MEETIELRQIIEIVLKGKWIITIFTIVAMLFAGIMSWFVLDENYESKAIIQLSSNVQDTGVMSNYITGEFTPSIYMQRMQNEVAMKQAFEEAGLTEFDKDNLNVITQENTNLVEVSYKNESPEEAYEQVQLLINKTKELMNASVKDTLNQLELTYLNESNGLSEEIEQLMEKYNLLVTENQLPEVLILQTIASSQFVVNLTVDQTSALANINGALQNELLQLKAQIDIKSGEYRTVLAKYQSVKTGLENFNPNPFIRIIIEPNVEDEPESTNKVLNVAIGLIMGAMLGLFVVFFRRYWAKCAKDK